MQDGMQNARWQNRNLLSYSSGGVRNAR